MNKFVLIATMILFTSASQAQNFVFSSFDLMDLQKVARKTALNESFQMELRDSKVPASCVITEKNPDALEFDCSFERGADDIVELNTQEMNRLFRTLNIPVAYATSSLILRDGRRLFCQNEVAGFTCDIATEE